MMAFLKQLDKQILLTQNITYQSNLFLFQNLLFDNLIGE